MPKTNLTQIEKELKAAYFHEYEMTEDSFAPFVTEVDSDASEELHAFLMSFPEIHEWLDARQLQSLEDFDWTIKNRKFEGTIRVANDDIKDNRIGGHLIEARQLGAAAADFFNDLAVEILEANGLCFDGQNFFDTDHKLGIETAWANTRSGSGIDTYAHIQTDFDTSTSAIIARRNPKNKAFFKRKPRFAVLSPAACLNKFEDLRTMTEVGGTPNPMRGRFDLIYLPILTDVNNWYVTITSTVIKAIIRQIREKPNWKRSPESIEGQTETSDRAFMYDEVLFGTMMRGNVSYGWPQVIDRIVNG